MPSLPRTTLPDFTPAPPVTGLGDAGVSPTETRQHHAHVCPAHRGVDARGEVDAREVAAFLGIAPRHRGASVMTATHAKAPHIADSTPVERSTLEVSPPA